MPESDRAPERERALGTREGHVDVAAHAYLGRAADQHVLALDAEVVHDLLAPEVELALRRDRRGADLSGQVRDVEQPLVPDRVAGEALENVVRHAGARQVTVQLERAGGRLTLTIADDGCGFDANKPVAEDRYGLRGMRERAGMIGGALEVESQPGIGTTVRLAVEVGT